MTIPSVQLFCFAYAGASAASYLRWKRRLPAWIVVRPVDLPGHGARLGEPVEVSVPQMLERIYADLLPQLEPPFALFGHSLGSVVAFELAHRLHAEGRPQPIVLFASGGDAPSRRNAERYANLRTDAEFMAELERLEGTPAAALREPELMALTLPILRADFAACAAYRCPAERRIACPIQVFGGSRDTTTSETLAAWGTHTTGAHWVDVLPGGHFFLHEQEAEVVGRISTRISSVLQRAPQRLEAVAHGMARRGGEPC
jgi:surfactin synthase thioesterase subunit